MADNPLILRDVSPAEVCIRYLASQDANLEVGVNSDLTKFSGFIGYLPEEPDKAIAAYDTSSFPDGGDMTNSWMINHPGLQLRVRDVSHADAWRKCAEICNFLDAVKRATITINSINYLIHAITRRGDPLRLSPNRDDDRSQFSINASCTITN